MFRFAGTMLFALCAVAPFSAEAVPVAAPGTQMTAPKLQFEEVAHHCPHGERYVRGHHARNGRWIRAHCVVRH